MAIYDNIAVLSFLVLASGLLSVILYAYLHFMRRKSDYLKSMPIFGQTDDLMIALHNSETFTIPGAFIRGCVKEKDLLIFDYMYEGVIRHSQIEEIYEISSLVRNNRRIYREERVLINESIDSVEFGLMEQHGQRWLVDDLGPDRNFLQILTPTRTSLQYPAVLQNHTDQTTTRTLKRVETKISLLQKAEPITIMGSISLSNSGSILFSAARSPYLLPNLIISKKSPGNVIHEHTHQLLGTTLTFYVCIAICAAAATSLAHSATSALISSLINTYNNNNNDN